MEVYDTDLEGVKIIDVDVFEDERGFFRETFHKDKYEKYGIPTNFPQTNHSYSSQKGTLRGFHLQTEHSQGKLVDVIEGTIYDVAVDLRPESSTFGKCFGTELYTTHKRSRQMYIPLRFAHGFLVVSSYANITYSCTDIYHPESEVCIKWDDPDIGAKWPITKNLTISSKDQKGLLLRDVKDLLREKLALKELVK